jgi:protoheme IX farnesyltransferase
MARLRFHQYAWGLLGYNLVVILGGAYVRASISGDGCGQHWPTCGGQLIPELTRIERVIEFGHRLSTGLLLPLGIGLVVWAFLAFPRRDPVRAAALAVLGGTLLEALIGAGLVLYRLVAHDQSVSRAVVMPLHLVATFLLLTALTLTAWWGSGGQRPRFRGQGAVGWALGMGLFSLLLLGVSGAIAALGDTLFPARTLAEGFRQDFSPQAHFLVGLRIYHPLIALTAGLYVTLLAGMAMHLRPAPDVRRFARSLMVLFLIQLGAGALNLLLLAPIWMQLVHLLLADLLWISLVLTAAAAVAEGVPHVELSPIAERGSRHADGPDRPDPVPQSAIRNPRSAIRDYVALTKPRVVSLLVFTTLAAMFVAAGGEGGRGVSLGLGLAVALGLYCAAGAANAINMVLERDLDLRMGRTAGRPTVTEAVPARAALQFAFALMAASFLLLWAAANLLSAMLALAGLAFYVIVYTLLLKRRTWINIVIGGAAGAFPPLVGWAAVTGDLSPLAWCLFAIIFLWTPVHFWALAIMLKEDYARAGVPMLPVVRGERATVTQIGYYALLTVAISAAPLVLGKNGGAAVGGLYVGTAVILNAALLWLTLQLYRRPDRPHAKSLFKYSMVYLALLFLAMAVDRSSTPDHRSSTPGHQPPTTVGAGAGRWSDVRGQWPASGRQWSVAGRRWSFVPQETR